METQEAICPMCGITFDIEDDAEEEDCPRCGYTVVFGEHSK